MSMRKLELEPFEMATVYTARKCTELSNGELLNEIRR